MILLAVETSTINGSLAIYRDKSVLSAQSWDKRSTHSDVALLALQSALTESGLQIGDVTHFAVDVGPGSFTGLRVGINMVRSLAFAMNRPVLGLGSLPIMAFTHCVEGESAMVAIRAIQNYYYAGVFKKSLGLVSETSPVRSYTRAELNSLAKDCTKVLIEGEGASLKLHASDLAQIVSTSGDHYTFSSWKNLKPLYIRASEAEEKLRHKS